MAIDDSTLYGLLGSQVKELVEKVKESDAAFKPFPDSVVTDGTTEQFMNSILALGEPVGTAFLGTVSLSDLPAGLVQEEVMVYVYSDYVVYCEVKSTDVAPYIWWCASYNYQGWRPVNTDTTYSAGTGLSLNGTTFSVNTTTIQEKLDSTQMNAVNSGITSDKVTKLDNIQANAEVNVQSNWDETDTDSDAYIQNKPTIPTVNNATLTITQNGTSVGTFTANASTDATLALADTTYSDFSGATSGAAGSAGLVPAPASGDTDKYLKSDGSWATVSQYSLPAASANTLGGVKIGSNLSMDANDVLSATDTTYSNFVGTDGTAAGTAGLVPAPATTDAGKFLKADGTWDSAGSSVNVVQTTGTSTTDVMSQNAVTKMIFPTGSSNSLKVSIGDRSSVTALSGIAIGEGTVSAIRGIAIGFGDSGPSTVASGINSVALGGRSTASGFFSIAMPASSATSQGVMSIGIDYAAFSGNGYNNSNYRLLTGLYDPQSPHDAATKGYADTKATITMTTTDPGEGSPLAANTFVAVYSAS